MDSVKRKVAILMVLVILVSTGITNVYADSNDIRKTMINFYKGNEITDVDKTALANAETLRFLSLFVSNFYVPFSTTLDDEDTNNTKDAIVKTLVNQCHYTQDTAETLVELVYQYTLSTAKPLYVNVSDLKCYNIAFGGNGTDGIDSVAGTAIWDNSLSSSDSSVDDGKHFNCTSDKDIKICSYGVFLELMAQGDNAPIYWADNESTAVSKKDDKDYIKTHTVWNWNPDGRGSKVNGEYSTSNVKISDLDKVESKGMGEIVGSGSASDFSASIEGLVSIGSYLLCANNINYSMGYGNAFMMYTLDSEAISGLKIVDAETTAKDPSSDAYKVCGLTAPLYVDWVGNIICDTGFCRYIVVPACQNPYSWSSASGKYEAGSFIQGCTLFALSAPNSSTLSKPSLQYYNNSHYAYENDKVNMGYWVQLANGSSAVNTLMNVEDWKQYVGSTSNSCDDGGVLKLGVGTDLINAMYTNLAKVGPLSNEMITDDNWLITWKSAKKVTGYHSSKNNAGTSYLGMVTIGDKKDVEECAGSNGKYVGKIPAFSTFLYVDSLNAYEGTDADDSIIKTTDIIKEGSSVSNASHYSFGQSGYNKISVGNCNSLNFSWASENNYIENIYLTYLVAYCNAKEGKESKIDLKFESSRFPEESGAIDWGKLETIINDKDSIQNKISSLIFNLLHPSEGVEYIATWVKNKIGGVFLSWHRDIVGGTNSNASTGITPYLGFSSYTTLPNLYDIEWVAKLLDSYNSIIIFLIVILAVILCCYVIVGSMTLQRGVFGVLLFSMIAFLPPISITAVTDTCNRTSDAILSSKFEYWALVQHQTYLADLYEASTKSDKDLYASVLVKSKVSNPDSIAGESAAGYTGVKLKWMSPKKENYLANTAKELDNITSNDTFKSLFYNIASPALSSQSFVDSADAMYVYRDYVDITNYAMKSYNLYSYYYGGIRNDGKKVASYASGNFKIAPYDNWKALTADQHLFTFSYKSGLTLREMVLRNNEKKYATDGYSKDDDLYGCTSIFALRSGFINNPTSITDVSSTDNLDYYSVGETSNLHLNLFLNFQSPYLKYISNFDKMEDIMNGPITGVHEGLVDIKLLGAYNGVTTGSGNRKYWESFGLDPHKFSFNLSSLSQTNKAGSVGTSNNKYSYDLCKDSIKYFYYSLYSESPYYYFSYLLQDNLNNNGVGYSYNGYKSNITAKNYVNSITKMLLANNQSFFYNYSPDAGDGYGELKDFMNMHDLFYYVYPILQDGSDLAEYFDKFFGIKMDEDMPLKIAADGNVRFTDGGTVIEVGTKKTKSSTEESTDDEEAATIYSWSEFEQYIMENGWTDEQIRKFWHNYEVLTILEAYTAWTDTMNDCSYAKPERIYTGGKAFLVENPLDPTSYFSLDENGKIVGGRYMVFSRSEMEYYGLEESNLTQVERKIIKIQDKVYKDCITLMNYSNFDDDVVLSALAMDMLFTFNNEFSEVSLLGSGHILYPTGYELKAFTYDAYMRLILSEATGEDLMTTETNSDGIEISGNIYKRILSKTSIFFAILLVFLDIMVTYIIPLLRLTFLISLFILSVIVIVSEAVKLELNIVKVTSRSLLSPLLSFGVVSVSLSWFNSLFMSNGNEDVIKGKTTISLGDPTMTVIAMIIINVIIIMLYWKILSNTFKNLKKFTTALATNVAGNVAGAVSKVAGGIAEGGALAAAVSRVKSLRSGSDKSNGGRGSNNAYSSADQRGRDNTSGKPKPIVKDKVEEALKAKKDNTKPITSENSARGNKYDNKIEKPDKEITSENVFNGLRASGIYANTTNAQNKELNKKYNSMVAHNKRVNEAYQSNDYYNNLMEAGIKLNRSQRKEVKKNNKQILYGGMGNRNILTKEGRHNVFSKEGRETRRLVKSGVNVGATNKAKLQRYANMASNKPTKKPSSTIRNKIQVTRKQNRVKSANKSGKNRFVVRQNKMKK